MARAANRIVIATIAFAAVACGEDRGAPAADAARPDAPANAPVITQVKWTPTPGCMEGFTGKVKIVTTVTDSDTALDLLVYSGAVSSCIGTIDSANAMVTCTNLASAPGQVTVADPDGHSATRLFTMLPCAPGTVP